MYKIKIFSFLLVLASSFQTLAYSAKDLNSLDVSSFLIAEIAEELNDYDVTIKHLVKLSKIDPTNQNLYIKLIQNNLFNNNIESANRYYEKLSKIGCNKLDSYCNDFLQSTGPLINGTLYLKKNRNSKAASAFLKVSLKINKQDLYLHLLEAWSWANLSNYLESIKILDSIQSSQMHNEIIYHKALIYDLVNEVELASIFYEQAIAQNQDLSLMNFYLNFLHRNNLNEKKESALKQLFQGNNYDLLNTNVLQNQRLIKSQINGIGVVLYNAMEEVGFESIDLSRSILTLANFSYPNFYEVNFLLANLLHNSSLYNEALALYKSIPKTHYLGGLSTIQSANLLSLDDQKDQAIIILQNFLKTHKNFKVLMTLADHFRYEEDWKKAIENYGKIIEDNRYLIESDLWNVYYRRGIAYERSNNWTLAEQDFLKALTLKKGQPDVLNYLGYSWIDSEINMDEAKLMIESALKQKPDDAYFIDSLAWYYFKTKDFEQANSLLSYAAHLEPTDAIINEHYGDTLWKVGRYIEARYQWNRALDLKPPNDLIKKIKVKLLKGY